MRSLLLLIAVAVLGFTPRASADVPPLVWAPRSSPPAEPAGGLQTGVSPQLRCEACGHLRVAGWGLFAAGYAMQLFGFGVAEYKSWTETERDLDSLKPIVAVLLLPTAIPIVGPVILVLAAYDGHLPQSLFQTQLGWAALTSSGAQLVGLAAAALGEHLNLKFEKAHRLAVVPLLQPGASGMAVGGTF